MLQLMLMFHGLSCKSRSGSMQDMQNINDLVCCVLRPATLPVIMELTGLSKTNDKQPFGSSLITWKAGSSVLWLSL